jgi:hemolysin activation/secretion protein
VLLPAFLEGDLRALGDWSSEDTPWSQRPTLGGEESVRGYRLDAFVGRSVWALQTEVWLPVFRCIRLENEALDKLWRRNLHLAAFADVGGVQGTVDDSDGFKAGAGLGLRVDLSDEVTLRLDWAQALTGSDGGRGGSLFYLSVVMRKPLFH